MAKLNHLFLPILAALILTGFILVASAHGGHGDDADVDSPPPNLHSRSLILVKIYCLILVFAGTFVGGISPYFLKWNEAFLTLGTQFAGGVFLGTALMHFLSDSNSTFQDLSDKAYPFAFMLASAGYLMTMLADCVIAGVVEHGKSVQDVERDKVEQSRALETISASHPPPELIGYGWAGMLRKYLVEPTEMWWPGNLAQVSLFRALHEKDIEEPGNPRPSRIKFFTIAFFCSFYYIFPGFLLPVLSFFSWICWVWPHSITAQQIGSGYHGLGIGTFTFDWAGISAYHGSPLVAPWFSILNIGAGFAVFVYIIVPVCYWKFNTFEARKFPIFSSKLFTSTGHKYDTNMVLTPKYELNVAAYNSYGKLFLSPLFAMSIGSGFARFTSTLTHVALFHGRDIWKRSKSAVSGGGEEDIHAKLMREYKPVPHWWFVLLLGGSVFFSILISLVYKEQVQLPWWGMLFAFFLAWIVTLPIGVIQATTNQQPGYDIIAQFIIGYILPGMPIANLLFKIYGRISTVHALSFLSDLKLGHYMKIPPRCMYAAQLAGTVVAGAINLVVAWWMLESIDNICDTDAHHADTPWTCPKYRVTFDASVIWGLIGPSRLFGHGGLYHHLIWLFLVGAALPFPIWLLVKAFPDKKWIRLINIPVILYGFAGMPPATPTNIASWLLTGTVFNYFVFRYRKRWWQKYNYVLSAALDAGTATMGVVVFFALQNGGVTLRWWGTEVDHCPLATCPTEPGIVVEGCPVF